MGLGKQTLILGVLFVLSSTAWATPWHWQFRVLTSEHFEVVYRADQRALAERYVLAAERAHDVLLPLFKEAPERTLIILQDNTDLANGEANFIPYPHIRIFPVVPNSLDSIDEFGDWPFELMLHEYAHILNMHPAHGIYAPFTYIFGTLARPNAVLPRWYLEGLAVSMETAYSTHGRLRAPETAAMARALSLNSYWTRETLPRINESSIITWPYGARPYVYGAWWWQHVQSEKGLGPVETWNQKFSRRLPFLLNGPVREDMNQSVSEVFETAKDRLNVKAQAELKQLAQSPLSIGHNITTEEGEHSAFAVSPSGRQLVYSVQLPRLGHRVMLKTRSTDGQPWLEAKARWLFNMTGTTRIRWLSEERLIFDQVDVDVQDVNFRELFTYDLTQRRLQRITNGARIQEPAPHPDGKRVVAIQNQGGLQKVVVIHIEGGHSEILVTGNLNLRLSSPEFLSDHEVVFSRRGLDGQERLNIFDLKSRKLSEHLPRLTTAQNARKTPKGLLVSDASTQVRNIYLLEGQRLYPVSNTSTDIQLADLDPQTQSLIYTELTADGRRLREHKLQEFSPITLTKPEAKPAAVSALKKVPVHESSFQPLEYLRPRYWIPFVYQVDGGYMLQAISDNADPVGRNAYTLMGSIDSVTNRASYLLAFNNRSLPVDLGASYGKFQTFLGASGLALQSDTANVQISDQWPQRGTRWSLNGQWLQTESPVGVFRRLGPGISWRHSRIDHPLAERFALNYEFTHDEFLPQNRYVAYGRTGLSLGGLAQLGGGHRLTLQARAAVSPRLRIADSIYLGERSLGANLPFNLVNSNMLLRGYSSGNFVGRKMLNANFEYLLPVKDLNWGMGTFPWFVRNLELALFYDTMAVDGAGYRQQPDKTLRYTRSYLSTFFSSTGAEFRLMNTAAYHLPISLTLGLYYGLNGTYGGGFTTFVGFGFGGFGPLQDETP